MRIITFYILFLVLLLSSCRKENYRKEVYAGIYDSSFFHYEFPSHLNVNIIWDSLSFYGDGSDSIDIDKDGHFDLIITLHLIDFEKYTYDGTYPIFPNCRLFMKNNLELVTYTETQGVGHGQTTSVTWVDALGYNDRIDNILEWSSNDSHMMWSDLPGGLTISNGSWYYLINAERYIGLRMHNGIQYKYGWIKVNILSKKNIHFASYAIEQ